MDSSGAVRVLLFSLKLTSRANKSREKGKGRGCGKFLKKL